MGKPLDVGAGKDVVLDAVVEFVSARGGVVGIGEAGGGGGEAKVAAAESGTKAER